MLIAFDEKQNNLDNNRRSSATDLEELFQQLLVLEKNPKPSLTMEQAKMTKTKSTTTTPTPPYRTMYNLRNMTALPTNIPLDTDFVQSRRTSDNNHLSSNNNHDIFCTRKKSPKVAKNYYSIKTLPFKNIVMTAILIVLLNIRLSYQDLCPKICTCDLEETICMESYGGTKPLHVLPDSTLRITLNNNQITQFTDLDYLSNLQRVNLAYNRINLIDFEKVKKTVLYVNTSHNNIVELKDSVVKNALPELRLTSSIYNIKNSDQQYEQIEILKRLEKINVTDFVLNHNRLKTIKNYTFIRWHNLQRLDLSYNNLSTLDVNSFYGLTKLEWLNLRGNRLLRIPSLALFSTTLSFVTTPETRSSSIKYLDLGNNSFRHIESDSFSVLEKAQELYLDSCFIESIGEQAFEKLQKLNLLSLDNNQLREVPTISIKYLSSLRILKMNSNQFTVIPIDSFSNLINLDELQLNFGYLHELQNGVFNGLDALKRLDISHNPNLTRIERGTMENLQHLNHLNLYKNNLTSLPDNLYDQPNASLQVLDLRENSLMCGCDSKWITKWLKRFNETAQISSKNTAEPWISYRSYFDNQSYQKSPIIDKKYANELVNLICAGPPALKKKLMIDLPDNKLECLKPDSKLNLHIGYGILYIVIATIFIVCLLSFCSYKKDLFFLLKENLVQKNISKGLPYNKNVDDLKKETQLYGSNYEHIDYNCVRPIYTLNQDGNEHAYYTGLEQSPQNNGFL